MDVCAPPGGSNRGEQAIRPAVVNRKVWGGNRTANGADAQAIAMSVLQTCKQQTVDAFLFVSQAFRGILRSLFAPIQIAPFIGAHTLYPRRLPRLSNFH